MLHEGSLESGHVTSLIWDWESVDDWYYFNDSVVSKMDNLNMREEAYGGNGYPRNAYILFYERKLFY